MKRIEDTTNLRHTALNSVYTFIANSIKDRVYTKCSVRTTVSIFARAWSFVPYTVRNTIDVVKLNSIGHSVEQLSQEFLNEKD